MHGSEADNGKYCHVLFDYQALAVPRPGKIVRVTSRLLDRYGDNGNRHKMFSTGICDETRYIISPMARFPYIYLEVGLLATSFG